MKHCVKLYIKIDFSNTEKPVAALSPVAALMVLAVIIWTLFTNFFTKFCLHVNFFLELSSFPISLLEPNFFNCDFIHKILSLFTNFFPFVQPFMGCFSVI